MAGLWHTVTVLNHPFLELSQLSAHFQGSADHSHTHAKPATTEPESRGAEPTKEEYYKELVPCFSSDALLSTPFETEPSPETALH